MPSAPPVLYSRPFILHHERKEAGSPLGPQWPWLSSYICLSSSHAFGELSSGGFILAPRLSPVSSSVSCLLHTSSSPVSCLSCLLSSLLSPLSWLLCCLLSFLYWLLTCPLSHLFCLLSCLLYTGYFGSHVCCTQDFLFFFLYPCSSPDTDSFPVLVEVEPAT